MVGVMACAKVVQLDKESGLFSLRREHKACLLGETVTKFGFIGFFGQKHNLLKTCFGVDGPPGIDQSTTPGFGVWLDSIRGPTFVDVVENEVLKVAGLKTKLETGILIADVGSGVGQLGMLLAERFPQSKVWALDIDTEVLKMGQERATQKNLNNMVFQQTDLTQPPKETAGKFDYMLAFDVIHDLPFPLKALVGIREMLAVGGVFSMFEPTTHSALKDNVDVPGFVSNYTKSLYVCVPHALNTPGGEAFGRQMGEEKASELLTQAGFSEFVMHTGARRNHLFVQSSFCRSTVSSLTVSLIPKTRVVMCICWSWKGCQINVCAWKYCLPNADNVVL